MVVSYPSQPEQRSYKGQADPKRETTRRCQSLPGCLIVVSDYHDDLCSSQPSASRQPGNPPMYRDVRGMKVQRIGWREVLDRNTVSQSTTPSGTGTRSKKKKKRMLANAKRCLVPKIVPLSHSKNGVHSSRLPGW